MIIDPADLDPKSSYKLLIGSVLPRAIAWVSTRSTAAVGNIGPVSFFTVVGRFPPILSISLQPRSDEATLKDTFVNIRDTDDLVEQLGTQRAARLDGCPTDYSPIDTAEWSPSGATLAAAT